VSVVDEEGSDSDLSSDVPVEREVEGRKGSAKVTEKERRFAFKPRRRGVVFSHELSHETEDRSKLLEEGFGQLFVGVRHSARLRLQVLLCLQFFLRDLRKLDDNEEDGEGDSESSNGGVNVSDISQVVVVPLREEVL